MASTALEQARASHERVERLERAIASEFKTEAVTHKARLAQSHRVNRALDEMVRETKRLRSAYADEDGAMREELAGMRPAGEDAAYAAFYARLRDARASHEQRPGALAPTPEEDVAATFHAEVPLEGEAQPVRRRVAAARRDLREGLFGLLQIAPGSLQTALLDVATGRDSNLTREGT